MPKNYSGQEDPTVGGERTYSGIPQVINEMEPGDLYGNDFPGAYVTPGSGGGEPSFPANAGDQIIAAKYGQSVLAKTHAARGMPIDESELFEKPVVSKAPSVNLDQNNSDELSPQAERTRQQLMKLRELHGEHVEAVNSEGQLDFNNDICVANLIDSKVYRYPGSGEAVSGAEVKRRHAANKEFINQREVLKQAAKLRAEEARALLPEPDPVERTRSVQISAGISDLSPKGKQQLRDILDVPTKEEFVVAEKKLNEVATKLDSTASQISDIHSMLSKLVESKQAEPQAEEVKDVSDT
ncbi:hypothetical protein [Chroococcidiopsis sp. CCMEE 29]|uniref:hypothetical protein n=1 Tax=Chroococcidiopsis sp. CCMEE 29 TaxID=155894 RepID=UPI00201FFE5A|nr:hypothetical protein [Chroococcidiopsis sp. CCMEE 29]